MLNNRNFNEWLSNFKTSISDYTYYVDFEKIYKNVDKVKVELNILNSLIGSKNIEEEFQNILIKYPETLECIPLLLAVRSREIFVKDEINEYLFKFDKMVYSMKDYIRFMNESGLFDLLQNHIINKIKIKFINKFIRNISLFSVYPYLHNFFLRNLLCK